jgi:hypothetical protein
MLTEKPTPIFGEKVKPGMRLIKQNWKRSCKKLKRNRRLFRLFISKRG